jgi:aminopeptidase C
MNIPLTQHTIVLYTDLLVNPEKYNYDYKPLKECFKIVKKITPQDELYEQYVSYINKPLPKTVFYIIMRNMYPALFGADVHKNDSGELIRGDLGFRLEFIKPL